MNIYRLYDYFTYLTVAHDTSKMIESFADILGDTDEEPKKFLLTLDYPSNMYIKLYMYNTK